MNQVLLSPLWHLPLSPHGPAGKCGNSTSPALLYHAFPSLTLLTILSQSSFPDIFPYLDTHTSSNDYQKWKQFGTVGTTQTWVLANVFFSYGSNTNEPCDLDQVM